jgi:methylglutaconyl-CoA hydratase
VITGAGKVFSSGADLDELRNLQNATREQNEADSRRLADLFAQIYLHPKAVIARINGHALAGGCGLAAVCDLSISTNEAKFGFPEVRIGFVPAIVSVIILRKIGDARARELFLRGHVITAQEAVEIGLITRTVPISELDQAVDDLSREIANETSGAAIGVTKRLIADIQGIDLHEGLAHAVEINASARQSADCRAGVAAFLERKDPPSKRDYS